MSNSNLENSLAFFKSELFHQVQLTGLFKDSKTFADAEMKSDWAEIEAKFAAEKNELGFELRAFVDKHFELPDTQELTAKVQHDSVVMQIQALWQVLRRPADSDSRGSLLPLPHPYSVPGGRFREIYYWDSYFTALGLVASGRLADVEAMLSNFMSLLTRFGRVPNGNRSYYHSRSQPPILALMAELIDEQETLAGEELTEITQALTTEYEFWMQGKDKLTQATPSCRRVVRLSDGAVLNRYWDEESGPRPESYREDIELATAVPEANKTEFFRHLRAACESGWDFSSRWLAESNDLASIRTTNLVPVDLNALLYQLETTLAVFNRRLKRHEEAERFGEWASLRRAAIDRHLWQESHGYYFDLDWQLNRQTNIWSLAGIVPLFVGACNQGQAESCSSILQTKFLKSGGLVTTLTSSPQQWDSPNGWAPLHWFAVKGLYNFGVYPLAQTIMERWLHSVELYFAQTGKLMEKYDVLAPELTATGGEYNVQEGFGWTNGVTMHFHQLLRPGVH